MMLNWLADRHDDPIARDASQRIEQTVAKFLADEKLRTADPGGTASTSDVATAIANVLVSQATCL